jgi:hypothetical protein
MPMRLILGMIQGIVLDPFLLDAIELLDPA